MQAGKHAVEKNSRNIHILVCWFWFFTGNSWGMNCHNLVFKPTLGCLEPALCSPHWQLSLQHWWQMNRVNDCQVLPDYTWWEVNWVFWSSGRHQIFLKFIHLFLESREQQMSVCWILQADGWLNGKAVTGSFSSWSIESVSLLCTDHTCLPTRHGMAIAEMWSPERGIWSMCI